MDSEMLTSRACRDVNRLCTAQSLKGGRCMSPRLKASLDGLCWFHAPEVAERRAAAQGSGWRIRWSKRRELHALMAIDVEAPGGLSEFRHALIRQMVFRGMKPVVAKFLDRFAAREAEHAERAREAAQRAEHRRSLARITAQPPAVDADEEPPVA